MQVSDTILVMSSLGDTIYSAGKKLPDEVAAKAGSHVPKIEAPDVVKPDEEFTIKVSVGPHPNSEDHSIRWIEIYFQESERAFNPVHVARIELGPGYAQPEVVLKLKLRRSGTLYVIAYCNKHGLWENKKEIKVSS